MNEQEYRIDRFVEHLDKTVSSYEVMVRETNAIIGLCRNDPDGWAQWPHELTTEQKEQLLRIEEGWETDPEAARQVFTCLGVLRPGLHSQVIEMMSDLLRRRRNTTIDGAAQ